MFQICTLAAMYAIRVSSREGGHDDTHPCALPHCHSAHIIKGGKSKAGTQRYKGLNTTCPSYALQLDLIYKGIKAAVLRSKSKSLPWRSRGAAFGIRHGY
jgi:hypothetical protein